ncbi:hypothetical protein JB92DRAFT_3031485 [Gautieria morchelliformis]|nr:hypothetical protein JB92DRAFT_3031485 [Gautieria morchelliformis]
MGRCVCGSAALSRFVLTLQSLRELSFSSQESLGEECEASLLASAECSHCNWLTHRVTMSVCGGCWSRYVGIHYARLAARSRRTGTSYRRRERAR